MKKKQEAPTKEKKEDVMDILRSEDEGFGIISEGYRRNETAMKEKSELALQK